MEPTIHFQAKKFEVQIVPHCCQYLCKHNIVPAMTVVLNDEDQYKMYDMAFMNIYFGFGQPLSVCIIVLLYLNRKIGLIP